MAWALSVLCCTIAICDMCHGAGQSCPASVCVVRLYGIWQEYLQLVLYHYSQHGAQLPHCAMSHMDMFYSLSAWIVHEQCMAVHGKRLLQQVLLARVESSTCRTALG